MAKQIRFGNDLHPQTPFYVFNATGGSTFVKVGGGVDAWSGAHIDNGEVVARYATLGEAIAAHPDAHVTRRAFEAVDSGLYK